MTEGLRVALPKGRIFDEAVALLHRSGVPLPADLEASRRLILPVPDAALTFILAKPSDVPTYVEYGVADVGLVGKDVLMEEAERDVYELLDLGISRCRIAVAAKPDWSPHPVPRVATKYPRIASTYFRERGQQVEIIKLNGSVELAPLIGLADRIVDIVSTGRTLRENGLVELETIAEVTTRLIANLVSYRMKSRAVDDLCARLEAAIQRQGTEVAP